MKKKQTELRQTPTKNGFRFNDIGVCLNPEEITYWADAKRPLIRFAQVGLFQIPETGEWAGAASCSGNGCGHHGCPSLRSQRFQTKEQAELFHITYLLNLEHCHLTGPARQSLLARQTELQAPAPRQLDLFSA